MSIESDCYSFLSETTAITDLVGTRIYPVTLPDDVAYPALVWTLISAPRDAFLSSDAGVVRCRFQFDVFSTSLIECAAVQQAIFSSLQRKFGTFGTSTIMGARQDAEHIDAYSPQDGTNKMIFVKSADYIVRLRQ
ncbi:MAG: DUF3168 domain-containing protein [Planctomycetaceae bacterium]|nr:DUF3168 domain-containing protein [Planctomycetaceae bacterium]